MRIINDGPGKDKPRLWYKGEGVCIWNDTGRSNCTQVLGRSFSCAFIAWHAPKWTGDDKELILLKWVHNNARIKDASFNVIEPQGGVSRINIQCEV